MRHSITFCLRVIAAEERLPDDLKHQSEKRNHDQQRIDNVFLHIDASFLI